MDNFVKKWSNQCVHDLIIHIKIPEPFCRASILARPQRQLPFSQCHFVGFLPSSPSSLILVVFFWCVSMLFLLFCLILFSTCSKVAFLHLIYRLRPTVQVAVEQPKGRWGYNLPCWEELVQQLGMTFALNMLRICFHMLFVFSCYHIFSRACLFLEGIDRVENTRTYHFVEIIWQWNTIL